MLATAVGALTGVGMTIALHCLPAGASVYFHLNPLKSPLSVEPLRKNEAV